MPWQGGTPAAQGTLGEVAHVRFTGFSVGNSGRLSRITPTNQTKKRKVKSMSNKFDELAKGLAQSVTRRQALKRFGVGLAGMALACFGLPSKARAATYSGYCMLKPVSVW